MKSRKLPSILVFTEVRGNKNERAKAGVLCQTYNDDRAGDGDGRQHAMGDGV